MPTWARGSSHFCPFGCSSPGRSSLCTESAGPLPLSGSGSRDTTYRIPAKTRKDNREEPFHCWTTETFLLVHVNLMMLKSTYTCLSRGTEGSTLSPRRGGVSPTRRSVVESAEPVVLPALEYRVCSVCPHERSRSVPSNWTETEGQKKVLFLPNVSEVQEEWSCWLPAKALEMLSFFHSQGWSYSSAGLSSSWGSLLSLLSIWTRPASTQWDCWTDGAAWRCWRVFSS